MNNTASFTVMFRTTEHAKQEDVPFNSREEAIKHAESLPDSHDWIEIADPDGVVFWDKAEGLFDEEE